jgi:hypothetical protein
MAVPRFLHNCPHEIVYCAKRPAGTAVGFEDRVTPERPTLSTCRRRPQFGDQPQDVGEEVSRDRDPPPSGKRQVFSVSVRLRGEMTIRSLF